MEANCCHEKQKCPIMSFKVIDTRISQNYDFISKLFHKVKSMTFKVEIDLKSQNLLSKSKL